MENNTTVNGKIIKCMARVHLDGLMEEFTLGSIMKTKNMDLEELNGQTVRFMKDTGDKVSKMDKEKLEALMVYNVREYGKTVRE